LYTAHHQQYNIDVRDKKQPLLLSRPKKREVRRGGIEAIHLVPELCTVTGLTDEVSAVVVGLVAEVQIKV